MTNEERTLRIKAIEEKVAELQEKRSVLVEEVQTVQTNLSQIKNDFKADTVLASELKRINKLRKGWLEEYNKAMNKLREIKTEIRELNTENNNLQFNGPKKKFNANEVAKKKVLELRDHYIQFNRDKTRIAAMRKMADQFILDLDNILKSF